MEALKQRIRSGEMLVGVFVKTPSPHVAELLGLAGLDFVVADREHAPIDLCTLDQMIGFAGASRLPILVRVPFNEPVSIAASLDAGAAGVLVPHVRSRQEAESALDAARYGRGKRGFSPSARAGRYGTEEAVDYRTRADAESLVLAQIEDREALDHLDEIASLPEIDMLFIGPADLAQSLKCAAKDAVLSDAIDRIVECGRRHHMPVGIFVGAAEQIETYRTKGVTLFVCGSDQSLLLAGARRLMQTAKSSAAN